MIPPFGVIELTPGNKRLDLVFMGILLGTITTTTGGDDDSTPAADKNYRLWTRRLFSVCCNENDISDATVKRWDDVGNEGFLAPAAGIVESEYFEYVDASTVKFGWGFKGRPHGFAEVAFQLVGDRTSVYIWHRVKGTITCRAGKAYHSVKIDGSSFPSHTLFVNSAIRQFLPQRAVTDLWFSHPRDGSRVRGRGPGGNYLFQLG